jgi:hypothetical protein
MNSVKKPTIGHVQQSSSISSSATPRVSDLDALMATKSNTKQTSNSIDATSSLIRPSLISPSPLTNTIRRSLFSTDAVKHVRPVRSQELKIFSCHLTSDTTSSKPSSVVDINEAKLDMYISPVANSKQQVDRINESSDDLLSHTPALIHELSEDSLNEHHHIKQLLASSTYSSICSSSTSIS